MSPARKRSLANKRLVRKSLQKKAKRKEKEEEAFSAIERAACASQASSYKPLEDCEAELGVAPFIDEELHKYTLYEKLSSDSLEIIRTVCRPTEEEVQGLKKVMLPGFFQPLTTDRPESVFRLPRLRKYFIKKWGDKRLVDKCFKEIEQFLKDT